MGYTVVWTKSAQSELAELWLNSSDRAAVTAAANVIDQTLRVDASAMGIAISEGLRALFAPPIRVLFAVRDADRIVEVLGVRSV